MKMLEQRGFTVAEVLVAAAIISIGLVGFMMVVPISTYGIQEGNQLSTATFLAEQKLEQVRNLSWVASIPEDCLGISNPTTAAPTVGTGPDPCSLVAATVNGWLADEANVGGKPYARNVRIVACAGGAECDGINSGALRVVTVTVTYRPTSAGTTTAVTAKSVRLQMLVAQR
jgi:prepilin-type N-terminal cleavage/methylation domain-containing protein